MADNIGVADSPALCERRIKVEREVYPRICRVATLSANGRSHLCDQTRATGSETRSVRHDEEDVLIYGKVDLYAIEALAISHR